MSSSSRSKKSRIKKWEIIPIPSINELKDVPESEVSQRLLGTGFCIRFFQQDMLFLYSVASHRVLMTRGVLDYLHDYNQLGPNKSRNKIFLCSEFSKNQSCLNGSLCREVHCVLPIAEAQDAIIYGVISNATGAPNLVEVCDDATLLQPQERPLNSEKLNEDMSCSYESSASSALDHASVIRMPDHCILKHSLHSRWTTKAMYPTLPSGVKFQVALPNTPTPVDEYDSGELFATKGAQEYYDHVVNNKVSTLSMQHCAHFTKNGICCFGEDCAFVHVVHQRQKDRADGSSSDVETISGTESSTTSESGRRVNKKKSGASKETPLSIDDSRLRSEKRGNGHGGPGKNLHSQPQHIAPNGLGDGRWFIPPQQGETIPVIMAPMPSQTMPATVHQNPNLNLTPNAGQFMMMPGNPQYQQQIQGNGTQPVYVFQPVYVQPNMFQPNMT